MEKMVIAFRVLGYSYDCKNVNDNKKKIEKEIGKIKTSEDAEKFFKSLKGEVNFIKETEELIEVSSEKVLYSFGYLNATFGYFFHDLRCDVNNQDECFFDLSM